MNKEFNSLLDNDLHSLLGEEDVSSNQPIPKSLFNLINDFKTAYIEKNGRLIDGGKKTIIVLMLAHGAEGLKQETRLLKAAVTA